MLYLNRLSKQDLLSRTELLAAEERKITAELLLYLEELEHRRLYAELGFSSLRKFCTEYLKMSEGAADRRIGSMRTLRTLNGSKVKEALLLGETNISNLSQLNWFIKSRAKAGLEYSESEKLDLFEKLKGKTARECERFFASLWPDKPKKDQTRPISANEAEITFTADAELMDIIEEARALFSNSDVSPNYCKLFKWLGNRAIRQLRKERQPRTNAKVPNKNLISMESDLAPRGNRRGGRTGLDDKKSEHRYFSQTQKANIAPISRGASEGRIQNPSTPRDFSNNVRRRTISTVNKRLTLKRDGYRCSYINSSSGRRCAETHCLEVDHILPWALGGSNELENLRTLCRAHNLYLAQQEFGLNKVNREIRRKAAEKSKAV